MWWTPWSDWRRNRRVLAWRNWPSRCEGRPVRDPKRYSARQAAYDLAKLRGKKLVRRQKQSRRYVSDPSGVRTMCAYLLLREKVIKPLLAGVVAPTSPSPRVLSPLDQHYLNLRQELNRTFDTIGLAE